MLARGRDVFGHEGQEDNDRIGNYEKDVDRDGDVIMKNGDVIMKDGGVDMEDVIMKDVDVDMEDEIVSDAGENGEAWHRNEDAQRGNSGGGQMSTSREDIHRREMELFMSLGPILCFQFDFQFYFEDLRDYDNIDDYDD
ncbi:hypothetical protein ETB97_003976 [Aspergillus alliaceus]|uniref:Uncharacterized protein n=1 Tax=Petromyces alliaceus TaxID=209559 RepID=A0A8H6A392_PETAA|nr:hypothetical protein ETB97_003976 [Aspergillus burnettii]